MVEIHKCEHLRCSVSIAKVLIGLTFWCITNLWYFGGLFHHKKVGC